MSLTDSSLLVVWLVLQVMVPYDYPTFINELTSLVNKGVIPMSRIDDAVRRILRVKFTMGLFEIALADLSFAEQLGSRVILDLSLLMPCCNMLPFLIPRFAINRSTGIWPEKPLENHSYC